jgi:hypothetical protein
VPSNPRDENEWHERDRRRMTSLFRQNQKQTDAGGQRRPHGVGEAVLFWGIKLGSTTHEFVGRSRSFTS